MLDACPRIFPPRESSYWIYISSAERLQHLSVADNPHFGLEDLQLTYEREHLASLNLAGCSALTSDALLVRAERGSGNREGCREGFESSWTVFPEASCLGAVVVNDRACAREDFVSLDLDGFSALAPFALLLPAISEPRGQTPSMRSDRLQCLQAAGI